MGDVIHLVVVFTVHSFQQIIITHTGTKISKCKYRAERGNVVFVSWGFIHRRGVEIFTNIKKYGKLVLMKITYLFGAGASKQCLPIVTEIPNRIKAVIELLKKEEYSLSDTEKYDYKEITNSKKEIQEQLIQDLEWLLEHSENHASIDTFAKKLFIKGRENDLKKLKAAFSVYLIIEQLLHKADKRYDAFYASLLNYSYSDFPEKVRILNWNYDSQFEISFSEYTNSFELANNKSRLNVITKHSYRRYLKNDKFCVLKLNGTTEYMDDRGLNIYNFIQEFDYNFSVDKLDSIIKNYIVLKTFNTRVFSGLSFAWERYGPSENDIVSLSKTETGDTEILIIIGYSFPFFNREIDREIIRNMILLKKVYFQAPDANILKERFLSVRDDISDNNLIPRFDVGQFLLPNEL
ncbi:MAG: hypothetical protein QM820_07520 [Minicystis sp.]